jgi:ribosome-binding factor A
MTRKQASVTRELRDAIGEILLREVRDPRVRLVSVVAVEISPDLRRAHVRISATASTEEEAKLAFEGVESAAPFIRRLVGQRVRLKYVPELAFERDRGAEHAEKITRVLRQIADEETTGRADGDTP